MTSAKAEGDQDLELTAMRGDCGTATVRQGATRALRRKGVEHQMMVECALCNVSTVTLALCTQSAGRKGSFYM